MSAPRDRSHIVLDGYSQAESFRPPPREMDELPKPRPPASRLSHGADLAAALRAADERRRATGRTEGISVHGATRGTYVVFRSQEGFDIEGSLDNLRARDPSKHTEIVAVHPRGPEQEHEEVVVFVPDGKISSFIDRLEKYQDETEPAKGERRYRPFGDSVDSIRQATIDELWTDATDARPSPDEVVWLEVWLRRTSGALERLHEFAEIQRFRVGADRLEFDDRIIVLVEAALGQLALSLDVMGDIAELRLAKETPRFFLKDLGLVERAAWVDDLAGRVVPPVAGAPVVVILDTGVNVGHPLLSPFIDRDRCHTVEPAWGTNDHSGHGTEMAGLAALGDLVAPLTSGAAIPSYGALESVKILPPEGHDATEPRLYGAVSAEATARVESSNPDVNRCYSMAVAARDQRDRGQPSVWSAAIDALAAGRSFDTATKGLVYLDDEPGPRRLFVLAAGNVLEEHWDGDHLGRSDIDVVHDPAQAWNALTVGAMTRLDSIRDESYAGWRAVAPAGELSPFSTTSLPFQPDWPLKPDVVFEGGNLAVGPAGGAPEWPDDLAVLSTRGGAAGNLLSATGMTSGASAQVSRIAAAIWAENPSLWPETVRGLIVHSARWTPQMHSVMDPLGKLRRAHFLRRYGHGEPSLDRARRSAVDALTLIAQGTLRPFDDEGRMGLMDVYQLPWPVAALEDLHDVDVRLRVTLSYFIEPNPGRRGWSRRYGYASHGLRFAVCRPQESLDVFRKHINALAREDGEKRNERDADNGWYVGVQNRSRGSIVSDVWTGAAAELATRNLIAVHPITGWWKGSKRDRSAYGAPYSLIVSIETDATGVDLWTPVATEVGAPITIEVG